MAADSSTLQAKKGHSHQGGVDSCPVFRMLPPPLQSESKTNEYLLDYIHTLPVEKSGVPSYHPELDRKMGDIKDPNLI